MNYYSRGGGSVKIQIALIHNNNDLRNDSMSHTVQALIGFAPDWATFTISRHGWQPKSISLGLFQRFMRTLENSSTGFLWEMYVRKPGPRGWFIALSRAMASYCLHMCRELWAIMRSDLSGARHIQVSRKHSQAWIGFVESDADWIVVLEDDALLIQGAEGSFRALLLVMAASGPESPLFAFVSAGFPFSKIGVEHLLEPSPNRGQLTARLPFVNTAGGYVMNRAVAKIFAEETVRNPFMGFNTIDFMMNRIFIRTSRSKHRRGVRCLHFSPPIVDNASITGKYSSSISQN